MLHCPTTTQPPQPSHYAISCPHSGTYRHVALLRRPDPHTRSYHCHLRRLQLPPTQHQRPSSNPTTVSTPPPTFHWHRLTTALTLWLLTHHHRTRPWLNSSLVPYSAYRDGGPFDVSLPHYDTSISVCRLHCCDPPIGFPLWTLTC